MSNGDDIQIDIGLDPSTYLAGVDQLTSANTTLQRSFGPVLVQSALVQKAFDVITPKRAALAAWGGMAAAAADTQQSLAGLNATATITHVNTQRLAGGMQQLARSFPIANSTARDVVTQFAQMGVASEGSEKKILDLSRSVIKLSGATGEAPQVLAQSMTQLARATGNTQLDPKRFAALGDSLTTISQQSGGGAQNILAFSKAIAPMAQVAGIGATGVLGISSAFAKMGDDGISASTAVSKMLADLNKSVQDGSPQLAAYAQVVGKTSDQFKALFKANPSQAIQEFTDAIAKAGPRGSQLLDEVGIDGIRSVRAIQELSAQGGVQAEINKATAAYGSGSTQKASEAAFSGLNDSMTELQNSARQLADAFGAPLLGPLTAFTKALAGPIHLLTSIVGSGVGQGALTGLAWGGMGAMALKALLGPLAAVGFTRQALTSRTARSFAAGMANRRGIPSAGASSTRLSRFGRYAEEARAAGNMGPMANRWYRMGQGLGNAANAYTGAPAGYSIADRFRMGLGALSSVNAMNLNMMGQSMWEQGRTNNPFKRNEVGFNAGPDWKGFGKEISDAWKNRANPQTPFFPHAGLPAPLAQLRANIAGSQLGFLGPMLQMPGGPHPSLTGGGLSGVQNALKSFEQRLLSAGQTTSMFRTTLAGALRLGGGATMLGARTVADGARLAGRGVGALAGTFGGLPGLTVMGGMALYGLGQQNMQAQKDAQAAFGDSSLTDTLDKYREAIGKATDTTRTVSSLSQDMGKSIALSTTTYDQARKVTQDDINAATGPVQHAYQGTDTQVAGQIMNLHPGKGLDPQDLAAVKLDLIREYGGTRAQSILNQLPSSAQIDPNAANPTPQGINTAGITSAITAAKNAPGPGGFTGWWANATGANAGPNSGDVTQRPGGWLHADSLTDTSKKGLQDMVRGVGDEFDAQRSSYGNDYAMQERNKAMNEAVKEAMKTGNRDIINEVTSGFVKELTGKNDISIQAGEVQAHGGNFVEAVAAANRKTASDLKDLQAKQNAAGGDLKPILQTGAISDLLKSVSPQFSALFNQQNTSAAGRSLRDAAANSGDLQKLNEATTQQIAGALKSGESMSDLAAEASKAASALSEASPEFGVLKAIQSQAQMVSAAQGVNMTASAAGNISLGQTVTAALQNPSNNQTQMGERTAAQQAFMQTASADKQQVQQYLKMYQQYDIQVQRTQDEANRQMTWSQQDYETQISRLKRNAKTAQQRMEEDYQRNVTRATQDFHDQQYRAERDFGISMTRATEDYNTTRLRANRDFNKQMQRQVEDAASDLYDVYDRIQTKPTWDAANLIGNMREQDAAMEQQKAQLDALRKKGLSQQAIDQLKLGDVANYQQVNQLSGDANTDPKVIAQLNAEAQRRQAAAGALAMDPSNKSVRRAKEDFATQMADMASDFSKNQKRARQDFSKSMADMAYDFNKTMRRGAEDLATNLGRATQDLNRSLDDMAADNARAQQRMRDQLTTTLKNMATDIKTATTSIDGELSDLATALDKSIHGKTQAYAKLIVDDAGNLVKTMQTSVVPNYTKVLAAMGLTVADVAGSNNSGQGGTGFKSSATVHISARNAAMGGPANASPTGGGDAGGYGNPLHAHYPMTSPFGYRTDPFNGAKTFHPGEDFGAPSGTSIFAALSGIVKWAGNRNDGYGNYVILDHGDGRESVYGHMSACAAKVGQHVTPSTVIGRVGSTGRSTAPHLHFETRQNGHPVPPEIAGNWSDNSTPGADFSQLFAGFDSKRGGIYGAIRDKVETAITHKLMALGFSSMDSTWSTPGDTGAHGAQAKANQAIAAALLGKYGFKPTEMPSLIKLWNGESGWNQYADNPSSDAYGIPQSLPGSKMATEGSDWRTNPATQIRWGLNYIRERYGSPSEAWREWNARSPHWYGDGGILSGAQMIGVGERGPEAVIPLNDAGVAVLARAFSTYLSKDEAREINTGNCSHMVVHHNERITYDQRNDFADAKITVVSQDPDDMGRKLEGRQRRQRLTQTRGVRWGR